MKKTLGRKKKQEASVEKFPSHPTQSSSNTLHFRKQNQRITHKEQGQCKQEYTFQHINIHFLWSNIACYYFSWQRHEKYKCEREIYNKSMKNNKWGFNILHYPNYKLNLSH